MKTHISLRKAVDRMELQSRLGIGFDIKYCSADIKRDTGGKKNTLKGVLLAASTENNTTSIRRGVVTEKYSKDPAHDEHRTLNIKNGEQLIKIHRYLIEEVDGMEVIF